MLNFTINMKCFLLLIFALVVCTGCGEEQEPPYNVVFVVIDTLRADHSSAYGYFRDTTPNLRDLASKGTLYLNAWSQAPWTCPSMVSMFTGRYVMAGHMTIPESSPPTLAEQFQNNGYFTGALVANPLLNTGTGFERGFDYYEAAKLIGNETSITADSFSEKAVELITEKLQEPFFTWLHLFDPHSPYKPAKRFEDRFAEQASSLTLDNYRNRQPSHAKRAVQKSDFNRFEKKIADYDSEVLYADDALGKIIDALRSSGKFERTIIVVTSDHGECLYSHACYQPTKKDLKNGNYDKLGLYMGHGELAYEESIHVPLVICGPGFKANVRHPGLVENVDLYPTLLAAVNLPPDQDASGTNLNLLGPKGKPGIFCFGTRDHALRLNNGMKLIHPVSPVMSGVNNTEVLLLRDNHPRLKPQLYALNQDPSERKNIIQSKPGIYKKLKEILFQWQMRYKDSLIGSSSVPKGMEDKLRGLGYIK